MTMMHDARGAAYLCDTIVVVSFFSPSESETETSNRVFCVHAIVSSIPALQGIATLLRQDGNFDYSNHEYHS